jgi:hypothetical protein
VSDLTTCIACAEDIKVDAMLCKHCGTKQDDPVFLPANAANEALDVTRRSENYLSQAPSFINLLPVLFPKKPDWPLKYIAQEYADGKVIASLSVSLGDGSPSIRTPGPASRTYPLVFTERAVFLLKPFSWASNDIAEVVGYPRMNLDRIQASKQNNQNASGGLLSQQGVLNLVMTPAAGQIEAPFYVNLGNDELLDAFDAVVDHLSDFYRVQRDGWVTSRKTRSPASPGFMFYHFSS